MNRFYKMLQRVNLQSISDMIQMGDRRAELNAKSMEEREDEAVRHLKHRLKDLVPEKNQGNVEDIAMEYANDCCEIYFTVGMKAGAKLMFQLLNDSLKDN